MRRKIEYNDGLICVFLFGFFSDKLFKDLVILASTNAGYS